MQDFWNIVKEKQDKAIKLAGVDYFYDLLSHKPDVVGFKAKSKYSKEIKRLVDEIEALRLSRKK